MSKYLYAIEQPNGHVKIGMTTNFKRRLSALEKQGGFKAVNTLVSKPIPYCNKAESILHKLFAEYRTVGEWFDVPLDKVCKAFDAKIWETDEYQTAVDSMVQKGKDDRIKAKIRFWELVFYLEIAETPYLDYEPNINYICQQIKTEHGGKAAKLLRTRLLNMWSYLDIQDDFVKTVEVYHDLVKTINPESSYIADNDYDVFSKMIWKHLFNSEIKNALDQQNVLKLATVKSACIVFIRDEITSHGNDYKAVFFAVRDRVKTLVVVLGPVDLSAQALPDPLFR